MSSQEAAFGTRENGKGDLRQAVAEGLLYTHSRLNANQRQDAGGGRFLYALIELLNEKGVITIEEFDARKGMVAQPWPSNSGQGQRRGLPGPEYDKYAFEGAAEIDCASRVHLCKAACCRLPFALSKQDVREGIVRWELGQPYLIEHGPDGYCTHLERSTCMCTIYPHRPVPCRGFDCRNEPRIWHDFTQMIPNPAVEQSDWPYCLVEDVEASEAQERDA